MEQRGDRSPPSLQSFLRVNRSTWSTRADYSASVETPSRGPERSFEQPAPQSEQTPPSTPRDRREIDRGTIPALHLRSQPLNPAGRTGRSEGGPTEQVPRQHPSHWEVHIAERVRGRSEDSGQQEGGRHRRYPSRELAEPNLLGAPGKQAFPCFSDGPRCWGAFVGASSEQVDRVRVSTQHTFGVATAADMIVGGRPRSYQVSGTHTTAMERASAWGEWRRGASSLAESAEFSRRAFDI